LDIKITYSKDRVKSSILIVDYAKGAPIDSASHLSKTDVFFELVKPAFEMGDFTGDWKETILIYTHGKLPEDRIFLIGLGNEEEISPFKIKVSFGHALKKLRAFKVKSISTFIRNKNTAKEVQEIAAFLVEATYLSEYRQPTYKKDTSGLTKPIEHIHFILEDGVDENLVKEGIAQGCILGKVVNEVRDLINKPANIITPSYLAEYARKQSQETPELKCDIYELEKLKELGMGGIINVGKGSREAPKLIYCSYDPKIAGKYHTVALVGKGVTFDSGGISIKPSLGMHRMKYDMAGAALVLGIIKAAALLKLPIKIIAVVPTCENMPGGEALKPGDIITAYDGTTVEVHNTDGEGRLILMDALSYAVSKNPDVIIDLATLTGACIVALGRYVMGGMTNYQPIMDLMRSEGDYLYERVWQLPLMEEYKLPMQSIFADLKNHGGKEAGAITAGAFLSHFVGKTPWIHLDIAGVSWFDSATSLMPEGASGIGVRLLIEFFNQLIKKDKEEFWKQKPVTISHIQYMQNEVSKAQNQDYTHLV